MYDSDYFGETEREYYERLAECDAPEWFDAELMPVFADAADALADMQGGR